MKQFFILIERSRTCANILLQLRLPNSMLLPQVAFAQKEVGYLLDKLNGNGKSQQMPKEADKATIYILFAEQQSIFEASEGVLPVVVPCPRTNCIYM